MRRSVWATLLAMLLSLLLTQVARGAAVMQTWSVGNEPFGVTVDPRDGKVYVAISDHNRSNLPTNMWVIDPTAPPWVPGPLPSPNDPFFELPGPQVMSVLDTGINQGRLFVASNGLAMVDLPSRAVTMLPIRGGAGMALDAENHRVYMATISGVVAVDGWTGVEVARRTAPGVSDVWWSVAHDATRHRVFVTNGNFSGTPSVVVLNDGDLSFVDAVPLRAIPRFALSVDVEAGLVYVGGFSTTFSNPQDPAGRLYAIDPTTLQVVKTLDLGGGVASVFSTTFVRETKTLYASMISPQNPQANAIVVVDTSTFTVTRRIGLSFQPGQSALHPDGRLYVAEFSAARLAAIPLVNAPPTLDVTLDSTSPLTNDVLHVTTRTSDPDGDDVSLTYAWSRNGAAIGGATGPTLDLALYGDRGDVLEVTVTADDGHGATTTRTATATVADSAPAVAVAITPSAPKTNDTIFATATFSDPDGDATCCAWYIKRNGTVLWSELDGGTAKSFDLSRPGWGDRGDTVTIEAVAGDGQLEAHATVSSIVVNSAPVASVALSSASPTKKDDLVASGSVFDADGDVVLMTYTWQVGSKTKLVVGPTSATSSSFDLREQQPGDIITVTLTPSSDGFDPGVPASSSATVRTK